MVNFKIILPMYILMMGCYSAQEHSNSKTETTLQEVVVTATRFQKKLKDVPIPVQVITAEQIRKAQVSNFQDFLENEFSGINFTYDGGSPNINMMGFGGKYVLFLIDGERMAGETFNNIDYDRINMDDIERVEIIKGASSSLYGSNAIGGVINIITKNTKKSLETGAGYFYDTNVDYKVNFNIGTKQKWGDIKVSTFYKYRRPYTLKDTEPLRTIYENGKIEEEEMSEIAVAGFTNYGLSPKIGLNISPKFKFTLTPTYYFNERNNGTNLSKKLLDRYYNYMATARADIKISQDKDLSITGAFDRYDKFKYYKLVKEQEKEYENKIARVSVQYNQYIHRKHSLVVGAEALSDELLSFMFNKNGNKIKKNVQTYAVFTQQDWGLSPKLTLVTGGRLDYHSYFKTYFTFRLSAMYKVRDFIFRGGYSGGFRSPTLKELYTNWFHPYGGGFQIMGNKKLRPESSDNYNFSAEINHKKYNITAMIQYSDIRNQIGSEWTKKGDTINYVNLSERQKIVGTELSAMYKFNQHLRLKGSYSFYDVAKRRSENRPHTLTFNAEYQSGRLYIPSVIFSGKYQSATNIYKSSADGDSYTRYSPFSIFRLQFFVRLPYNITLEGGINNIFDYVAKTNSFYSPTTIGRTYFTGFKWNL